MIEQMSLCIAQGLNSTLGCTKADIILGWVRKDWLYAMVAVFSSNHQELNTDLQSIIAGHSFLKNAGSHL